MTKRWRGIGIQLDQRISTLEMTLDDTVQLLEDAIKRLAPEHMALKVGYERFLERAHRVLAAEPPHE